ncbi:MAG: hypothetical protein ACU0CO_11855, partial [Shimia sp.]
DLRHHLQTAGDHRMGMTRLLPLLLALAAPAEARLLCLGLGPGFMSVIEGEAMTLDYLGDGTYRIEPPVEGAPVLPTTHTMVTMRERWDVTLTPAACQVARATLDYAIEIGVPTSAGIRPLTGCCKWSK